MHYASENGHIQTIEELIRLGANPNALDNRKYTAFDVAKTHDTKMALCQKGGKSFDELENSQIPKLLSKRK